MSNPIEANAVLGGRYRLLEVVADRGAGEVWRVIDERREDAALMAKFLRPIEGDALSTKALSVIRALKALRHPAVPTTFNHGVHAGRPWVVSDEPQGRSLGTLLDHARERDSTLDLALLRAVFDAVAGAIAAAHGAALPLVHGVLTPGSVIVLAKPAARAPCALLDLGLMPWLDTPEAAPARSARTLVTSAPELLAGAAATDATDVFALGALLTEMLALPASAGATLAAVSEVRRRPDVPVSVWKTISVAMMSEPGARFGSVPALVSALESAWKEPPPQARSRLAALVAGEPRQSSGSLFETAVSTPRGPSLTPSSTPAAALFTAPTPAPLALPAPTAPSISSRLAQMMESMPPEPNPWATDVRQREVALPASFAAYDTGAERTEVIPGPSQGFDEGATLVAAPKPATRPVAAPPVGLPFPMNEPGGTLVSRRPAGLDAPPTARVEAAPRPPTFAPATAEQSPSRAPLIAVIVVALVVIVAVLAFALTSRA